MVLSIKYKAVSVIFVDLCKAYDSVCRVVLLQNCGVPNVIIELLWSLHDGMSATVIVGDGRSEPFLVWNGGVLLLLLCLSCTLG